MYQAARTLGLLVGLTACQTVLPSTTLQEKQVDSYVGMDFETVDNGLVDCNIPFDDLTKLSPDCTKPSPDPHKRCEGFSPSQFPEIAKIKNISYIEFTKGPRLCSGTVIGPNWVLSAAHCFLGDSMPASYFMRGGKDLVISLPPGAVQVDAENAITLKPEERSRDVTALVIPTNYTGDMLSAPYLNDLALLRLSTPFPSRALRPARIALPSEYRAETTIGGYGYSDAEGGTLGKFDLTWPPSLSQNATLLNFTPGSRTPIVSAFCQGDSGGPVLAGRYRGCKPNDPVRENRPRLIEGVISYDKPGDGRAPVQTSRIL